MVQKHILFVDIEKKYILRILEYRMMWVSKVSGKTDS